MNRKLLRKEIQKSNFEEIILNKKIKETSEKLKLSESEISLLKSFKSTPTEYWNERKQLGWN